LAVGSFTQQAIKSVPCDIALHNLNASLLLAQGSMSSMVPMGPQFYFLDAATKGRVVSAFIGTSSDRSMLVQGCTTGSCTFADVAPGVTHITSGFCSKCLDVTDSVLEGNDDGYSYSYLPNGIRTGGPNPVLWMNVSNNFFWNSADMTNASWSDKIMYSSPDFFEAWNASVGKFDVLMSTTHGCEWSSFDGQARDESGRVLYNYDCSHPSNRLATEAALQGRWNVVSASCIFYPCVKELAARVENGSFSEEVVRETPIYPFNPLANNATSMINTPCYIDNERYETHNFSLVPALGALTGRERVEKECTYTIPSDISLSIVGGRLVNYLAQGYCRLSSYRQNDPKARSHIECFESDQGTVDNWWLSSLYNNGNATFDTVAATMSDVATALTDSMRLTSVADDGLNENNTVNGTVLQASVCTEFDWRWLLFPMALIALAIGSLVLMIASTVFSNNQIPVWKSSILPFLYLGNIKMHTMSLEEMEKAAKKDKVALQRNGTGGWQLVPGHEERDNASG
jgi:hypothetical protein